MSVVVSDSSTSHPSTSHTAPSIGSSRLNRSSRSSRSSRPDSATPAPGLWLDAAPFRAHVVHLMSSSGLSIGETAALTGVSVAVIRRLLHGRSGRPCRRIDPASAHRLFSVTPLQATLVRSEHVAAGRARAHIQFLLEQGRSTSSLGRLTGLSVTDVSRLAAGDLITCAQIVELRLSAAVAESETDDWSPGPDGMVDVA